ncbi:MAG: hypothetical protein ACE5FT_06260 [Candidatus Nanoarchaeia archaeon]
MEVSLKGTTTWTENESETWGVRSWSGDGTGRRLYLLEYDEERNPIYTNSDGSEVPVSVIMPYANLARRFIREHNIKPSPSFKAESFCIYIGPKDSIPEPVEPDCP